MRKNDELELNSVRNRKKNEDRKKNENKNRNNWKRKYEDNINRDEKWK